MQISIDQIESEVKQLSAEDLRKVRRLVDSLWQKRNRNQKCPKKSF